MKKIVSVLLLLALVFGAVYAQSVTLNYRTQANIFKYDTTSTVLELFDNDGYSDAKDSLTFNLAGKTAGAKLELGPNASTKALSIAKYEGWVKFGDVKIGGGQTGDVFRANRVTTDAGNWGGSDFEKNKIGAANGSVAKAVDSIVTGGLATYVEFAPKFGDNTLFVKVANVTVADDFDNKTPQAGLTYKNNLGAILAYNMKNVVDVEFVARLFSEKKQAFGLYVQPLMVKGLTMTVGGAIGIDADKEGKNELGIDLRARYAVDKQLSLTTMHNFSISNAEKQYLWNMVNAKYKINDLATVQMNFSHINSDLSNTSSKSIIRVTPGVIFTASEGCSVTTGVALEIEGDKTTISMPMVLRVKM